MTTRLIGYKSRWSPLEVYDKQLPSELTPTQLRIKVSYIALNPIDIKLKSIALVPHSHYRVGKEFSGLVEEVGSALADIWKKGDRICGSTSSPVDGFIGTVALLDVHKHVVMKPPRRLSDAEAAAFPLAFATASELIQRTNKHGKLLVLGGATTVGTYLIQLAKKFYAFEEIVASCSQASNGYVTSLGADRTVDYKANLGEQLKALNTNFDAVLDTVGGYEALRVSGQIMKPAKDGGVYASVAGDYPPSGAYSNSFIRLTLKTAPWALSRIFLGRLWGINYQLVLSREDSEMLAQDFFTDSDVVVPIDSIYPLEGVDQGWERLDKMLARGKVLISTSGIESQPKSVS